MTDARGPLDGISVIDLTTARSGPTCVRQLVDLGATAVQVVPIGKDFLAGSDGWNLHRGKRSIAIDLQSDDGREVLLRLVDRADVLVENYRPGVKHRLRIDPDTLLERNPRLVYASISGFGQTGPYADRPGVDQIAQGLSGVMSVTGPPGSGPWRTGIAISDTVSGTFLAQAIAAALYARELTGRGQWVHTSLLESMINIMDFQAARYLNEGDVPGQAGNDHPTLFPMGTFQAADGWVNIASLSGFSSFCTAIGAPELTADPLFADTAARATHREPLRAAIEARLQQHPAAHWVEVLNAAGFPSGPVLRIDECFADPQVQHLALVEPVPHPTVRGEEVNVLRYPVTLTETPAAVRGGPPAPGVNTREVLTELGYDDGGIDELLDRGVVAVGGSRSAS